jgi:hypothetical protein
MPEKETLERVKQDQREGKSPNTQAGEFVREEMHHIREGKHGLRSPEQAIAIGLSKARRAGVKLAPPKKGTTSPEVRAKAERDSKRSRGSNNNRPSARHSGATIHALKKEGRSSASHSALGTHARSAARKRGRRARQVSAIKAIQTKGPEAMHEPALKAKETRRRERT